VTGSTQSAAFGFSTAGPEEEVNIIDYAASALIKAHAAKLVLG